MHTSSTHAGFEFAILPWGDRNFEDNLAPHGWFAAEYRTLLRSMLVREEGDDLHLLSVLSPDWIGARKTIAVKQAQTYFGEVAFTMDQPSTREVVLKIDAHFERAPHPLLIHLPWFLTLQSATADGRCVSAKEVRLQWHENAGAPQMSYAHAVEEYKAESAAG